MNSESQRPEPASDPQSPWKEWGSCPVGDNRARLSPLAAGLARSHKPEPRKEQNL
jgi:hypothetical protein